MNAIDNRHSLRHSHLTMRFLSKTTTLKKTTGKQKTLFARVKVCGEARTV